MKKAAFYTLGCKVNQYETQAMAEMFEKEGYTICNFSEIADVYVVNSCTVTAIGDKKSRQAIRRAKRLNPNSVSVLTGCYAQKLTDDEIRSLGADIVLGTGKRNEIIDAVNNFLKTGEECAKVDKLSMHREFEETPVKTFDEKTRGMIKIQDGCNRFCSYCIIPDVRGPVRSRKMESILSEAERLAASGFKEIVLAGIQVAAYGSDNSEGTLADVIVNVSEIDGIERIRLSSLEVVAITDEFLKKTSATGKLCPSFHLSLQSGSKSVLQRMNRRYTPDEYFEAVNLIRKYFLDAAITTDMIVGFPGETEEEFTESYNFARKVKFAKIHTFPYSKREGTTAAEMAGQLDKGVKDERAAKLIKLGEQLHNEFINQNIGKIHKVLFEQKNRDGDFEGYTENYIKVVMPSDSDLTDKIKEVTLSADNIII